MNTLSLVHDQLRRYVKPGMTCVDATAGNGRDTAFLCELVGEMGKVVAFDIQQAAIDNTNQRLRERKLDGRAWVIHDSHANLEQYVQQADCVVFNLGWLPGGDHSIFTHPDSTIAAIEAGLRVLRPGGLMTVSIYYGGASGYEERDALMEYVKTIDSREYTVLVVQFANRGGDPPIPVFILKEG